MVEPNREVDQAVSALATEIIKLSPTAGDARDSLCLTIENALTRLAVALLAQANETQEKPIEEALPAAG